MLDYPCNQRSTATILTNEIDELCATYRAAPIDYVQLTPGRLGAEIHDIATPRMEVREAAFEAGVLLTIASPFPRFAVGISIRGPTRLFGSNLTNSNLGCLDGRNGVLAHVQAGSKWCNISIDHEFIRQVAEVHNYAIPSGDHSCGLPIAEHTNIANMLSRAARMESYRELTPLQLEDKLTRGILRALNSQQKHQNMKVSRQWKQAQRAIEYIHAHYTDSMTVTGLCQLAGVSERTMQHVFREMTGFSMQQYLMRYRLHRARALLSGGTVGQVKDAAIAVGIPHTGRFSLYFRELFGESPHRLLASSPTPISASAA